MPSTKYIFWVAVGAALTCFIVASLFLTVLGKPAEAGRWVNECLTIKQTAIERRHPKIVILSGSNGLFGFSAQRLSEVHGVSAVNAAVHAGLGIKYILHYGRQKIIPGRVFVLPLEYQLYGKMNLANDALIYQIIGYDPSFFWGLPVADKLAVMGDIPLITRARMVKNLLRPAPRSSDGYQSTTLNAFGDETANTVANRTKALVGGVKRSAPSVFTHHDDAWNEIARFTADAKAKGATVVLAHPNIYAGVINSKRNDAFFREIPARAGAVGLKIIGTPIGAAFNDDAMFDTVYHQNTQGQMRSTDRLLSELRSAGII